MQQLIQKFAKLTALVFIVPLLLSNDLTLLFAEEERQQVTIPSDLSASEPTVLYQETKADGSINALISLPAVQDTYAASNPRSINFGGADTLLLGYNSAGSNLGALRLLIRFDFPGPIPSGAIINSARIRLYLYGVTGDSMSAQIRHLVSGWNEYEVTWDNHEPDWGSADTSVGIGVNPGWVEWDITRLAKQWQNGSEANDGIIVLGNENPGEHQRAFWSREGGNGQHPQLLVDYSQSAPDREAPHTWFEHPTNRYQQSDRFTVEWKADDPGGSGVDYYDIQYREAGQNWQDWLRHTTETRSSFLGQNGKSYEFRGRAVDKAHNVEAYSNAPQAATTVDIAPPAVTMQALPAYSGDTVQVAWSGVDPESGIQRYELLYSIDNQSWNSWLAGLTQTSAQYDGVHGQTVGFAVRAIDNANNASTWNAPNTFTFTTIDGQAPVACISAIQGVSTNTYRIHWAGDDGAGAGIRTYDVRYRFNNGEWQSWQQQVGFDNAVFTPIQGDGAYFFTVRAVDHASNQGAYQESLGSTLRIGFTTPSTDAYMLYLPFIGNQRECKL
ncbi:MAG: DNRLRE domain-containing protein [Caldilineaceae bacterium]